jgi:hypothetical protein
MDGVKDVQEGTFHLVVVSTHVLTSGLAIPALAALASTGIILVGHVRNSWAALGVLTSSALVGYIGGTYYSLSYLQGADEHTHWPDCTRPSIIAFAILTLAGFAGNVMLLPERNGLSIGILAFCYLAIIVAFAWITASGFRRMAHRRQLADSQQLQVNVERGDAGRFRFQRLLGGGVGLAIGFAVGLGIAIYFDRGGWQPQRGWQMRFVTALVVGGIGALLGLVSGPPRR